MSAPMGGLTATSRRPAPRPLSSGLQSLLTPQTLQTIAVRPDDQEEKEDPLLVAEGPSAHRTADPLAPGNPGTTVPFARPPQATVSALGTLLPH